MSEDDEIYGFQDKAELAPIHPPGTSAGLDFTAPKGFNGGAPGILGSRPPPTAMRQPTGARMPTAARQPTGRIASRMGTAAGGDGGRPMTSVAGAGYQSQAPRQLYDPLGQGSRAVAPSLKRVKKTPEDKAKDMEEEVHTLLEKSADAARKEEDGQALERAKEAGRRERMLVRYRESNSLMDAINLDLTYAVQFNLALCYEMNGMDKEALSTFSMLVKNKQYPHSQRLRANMGNIYFRQGKYSMAIRMYRMALDQIPNTCQEVRDRILRNISNAHVRSGEYQQAINSLEIIMDGPNADIVSAYNLVICHYALGQPVKMEEWFSRMLDVQVPGVSAEEDEEAEDEEADEDAADPTVGASRDRLAVEVKERKKHAQGLVSKAARLIAPALDKEEWVNGFDRVIEMLDNAPGYKHVAIELEMCKANTFLRNKQFAKAIEVLKGFEKKDEALRAQAATNLSFLYFLEGKQTEANEKADAAVRHDRYNAKALVNKGNCLFMNGEYERAKELFLEAIGVEADCVEAIYNLGLVNKRLALEFPDSANELLAEALQAFDKLHSLVPNSPEVIYQIAVLHETLGSFAAALDNFNILLTKVPTDPGVNLHVGQLFSKQEDEGEALRYHRESYSLYPVNLDVISWLGVWFVKSEMYEQAIKFFERAAQIQPQEVKWRLMVASCYRRMNDLDQARKMYEQVHSEHPQNLECLRYLVAINKELGLDHTKYQAQLARMDRAATVMGGPGGGYGETGVGPVPAVPARSHGSSGAAGAPIPTPVPVPIPGGRAPASPPPQANPSAHSPAHGHDDSVDEFADADVGDLLE